MEASETREPDVYAEFDVGNLCVYNIINLKEDDKKKDDAWLQNIATAGAQALLNKLWELPVEDHDSTIVIKLPEPSIKIPREKPLPKKSPPTKWEQFAKEKHLKFKKKEKLLWDETSKEWKPRYGYRSIKNTDRSDWVVELPPNADPNVDYIGKKKEEKSEAIAKNELHRLRNIASATKLKIQSMESVEKADKEQLLSRLSSAKTSTASLGKFTKKLPKEKAPKNSMKKRKFAENVPREINKEKEKYLKIFANLQKKKPKLDIQEAVQLKMCKKQPSEKKNATEKLGKKSPKSKKFKRQQGKRNRSQKKQKK